MRALVYLFAYILIFISGLPVSVQAFDSSDSCSIHKSNSAQAERIATNPQKILAKCGEADPQGCEAIPSVPINSDRAFHKSNTQIQLNFNPLSLHGQEHLCPRAPPA